MTDNISPWKGGRRWPSRVAWTVLLVVTACAFMDYSAFHVRKRRALAVVTSLGGQASSIGGWPWGEENVFSFPRALSDSEVESLAVLNNLQVLGRHHVTVVFRCDLTEARLAEIRRTLDKCRVYMEKPIAARESQPSVDNSLLQTGKP